MRLPKFRCKNKIGNWCFFTVLHNGNVNEENFYLETLSQFTGLFDKQGLEIYEGDIVKFDSDLNTFIEIEFSNKGKEAPLVIISEVVFKNGMYVFDYMFGWEGREVNFNEVEVIGNIYENPELLK